jgi:GxxExxY protein
LLFRFGGPKPEFARRVLSAQSEYETLLPDPTDLIDRANLLHPDVTYEIIGGALEVFRLLGPGFIHRIYANACYHELKLRGLEVKPHREFRVFLDDIDLGGVKLGHLQIEQHALLFPVAVSDINTINLTNLQAWLRYLDIPLGILVNFKTTRVEPLVVYA